MSVETASNSQSSVDASGRVFARALQKATSDVKGITGLLLAIGAAIASYIALKSSVSGPKYLPEVSALAVVAAFYFFYVHPEWREQRRRHRLDVEGVGNQIADP